MISWNAIICGLPWKHPTFQSVFSKSTHTRAHTDSSEKVYLCISEGRSHPCNMTWGLRCSAEAVTLLPHSWKITSFSCLRARCCYCSHPSASARLPGDARGLSRWKPQSNEGPSASLLCAGRCATGAAHAAGGCISGRRKGAAAGSAKPISAT